MNTKKILFAVILGLIFFISGVIFYQFKKSDDSLSGLLMPELKFASMKLKHLTSEQADLDLIIQLSNTAPVPLSIDSMSYKIYVSDQQVASSSYINEIEMNASGSTDVSLPVKVYYKNLDEVLHRLNKEGKDSVEYEFKARIYSGLLPNNKYDIEKKYKGPALRIPEIKLTGVKIKNFTSKGATIDVMSEIKNDNLFPFEFNGLTYSIILEDQDPVKGKNPVAFKVPAKGSAGIVMSSQVDIKELNNSIIDLIRKGKNLRYKVFMKSVTVSEDRMLNGSEIDIVSAGRIEDLKRK